MFIKEKEDIFEMDNDGKKSFFKSGRFLLTGLASAVLATAAVNLVSLDSNSANADDVKVSYASGIVSWKANDQETIQRNMLNQGITGIDQLSNYKVVWGDTLSGIAQHFGTTVESIAFKFGITNPNFIVAGVTVENQHLLVTNETVSVPSTATQVTDFFAPSVNKNSQSSNSSTTSNSAGEADNSKESQSVNASSFSKASDNDTNATPAAKPSESVPAGNSSTVTPAPNASVASSNNNDTNVGGASEVITGQTGGSNSAVSATPATQHAPEAPAEAQKPAVETPKTDAPAPATNTPTGGVPSTVPAVSNSDASSAAPTDSASSAATTPQTPATSGSDTSTVAPTTNGSDAASSSETPTTPKPSTGNDAEPSTVVPANPKDGDHFNGVDSLTGYSYGILTYQASTGYWLDTFGNDRDPYNPQNIRHTADQIAAIKAADEKAHEIVPGTELTRPDNGADSGSSNIGSASDVISSIIGG